MKSICDVSNSAYQFQLQVKVRVAFAWKSAYGSVKRRYATCETLGEGLLSFGNKKS
jgi:uncharacterized lipoprotein YajG